MLVGSRRTPPPSPRIPTQTRPKRTGRGRVALIGGDRDGRALFGGDHLLRRPRCLPSAARAASRSFLVPLPDPTAAPRLDVDLGRREEGRGRERGSG